MSLAESNTKEITGGAMFLMNDEISSPRHKETESS